MPRWLVLAFLIVSLGGCSKPALPDTPVRAASPEELADFRAELGSRFTPEELSTFDTALVEMKLEAISRGVATAAEREAQVQVAVQGMNVHQVEILGWLARRSRLLSEIATMTGYLDNDLKAAKTASVATHIQNEQEILARLHRDLAATEQQLTAWGVAGSH